MEKPVRHLNMINKICTILFFDMTGYKEFGLLLYFKTYEQIFLIYRLGYNKSKINKTIWNK